MSFWDDLGDALKFEVSQLEDWWGQIKENPEQLIIGAADPTGAEIWSGITGKDYQPLVSEWGGPTEETFASAEEKGIDTEAAGKAHEVAEGIAKAYAMNWGFGKLGEWLGNTVGGTDGQMTPEQQDMIARGFQQFGANMQQQAQEEPTIDPMRRPQRMPPPAFGPAQPAEGQAPGTAVIPGARPTF